MTRPYLAFIVNKLSQFLQQPTVNQWKACKRVLRYIKSSLQQGGHCIYLGRNLINWSSKKQDVVARSSAESEYRSLATAATDIVWVKSLFAEIGIEVSKTAILWCDNSSAIALASNPVFHARTKHIEVDVQYIRQLVQSKTIEVRYITSEEQLADMFTKPLSVLRFQILSQKVQGSPSSVSEMSIKDISYDKLQV